VDFADTLQCRQSRQDRFSFFTLPPPIQSSATIPGQCRIGFSLLLPAVQGQIVETLAEMRELKGEMKEFKEHAIGRLERLEKRKVNGARNG
jgi:hypothetical protein